MMRALSSRFEAAWEEVREERDAEDRDEDGSVEVRDEDGSAEEREEDGVGERGAVSIHRRYSASP